MNIHIFLIYSLYRYKINRILRHLKRIYIYFNIFFLYIYIYIINRILRHFPGTPVFNSLLSIQGVRVIPGQGTKICMPLGVAKKIKWMKIK